MVYCTLSAGTFMGSTIPFPTAKLSGQLGTGSFHRRRPYRHWYRRWFECRSNVDLGGQGEVLLSMPSHSQNSLGEFPKFLSKLNLENENDKIK
jgi:hypothetical protein